LETRRLFFILLSYINIWNLGCRTNNTEGIRLSHLFWQMDALRIDFGITKTNQSGDRPETRLFVLAADRTLRNTQPNHTTLREDNGVWPVYLWSDGVFHKLPEDYKLPQMSVTIA
jgi:hypothetical protein